MKKKIVVLLVLLLCASAAGYFFLQSRKPKNSDPIPQDLEALRSVPYVQWTNQKADRKKSGVITWDRDRAYNGLNLYTNDRDKAYLLDMEGKIRHNWELPGKKNCECVKWMEGGGLLAVCVDQALVKLDWNSRVIWEKPIRAHHDAAVLQDGTVLALSRDDGVKYVTYKVEFDNILHFSESGDLLKRWSTFENLPRLKQHHPPSPLDTPRDRKHKEKWEFLFFDYYHLNALVSLPQTELGRKDARFREGNLLICSRHLDWIAVLDKDTRDVLWSYGPGILDGPHNPTMLSNGNILIFDNGTRRNWSRVLEIEPASGKIVWEYKGSPPGSFFSAWRGSCQRLSNGNTLITDSESGRVFEIDRNNRVVWDFWNPEIRKGKRKRIYRMTRLDPETIVRAEAEKKIE